MTSPSNGASLPIARSLAYYLPQFHRIPENDAWWGAGFTEWSSLRKAKPLHPDQIIQSPGSLGYYDLTSPEVIGRQHQLAAGHSVGTFAFWHYWFGDGELLLEKPAENLLESNESVSFCFAWANHDWVRKSTGEVLKRQRYDTDAVRHFAYLEPFLHDTRYCRIDDCPVFLIFSPGHHPHLGRYADALRTLAQRSGLPGLCLIFDHCDPTSPDANYCDYHLNATRALKFEPAWKRQAQKLKRALPGFANQPQFGDYRDFIDKMNLGITPASRELPLVMPGWDTTIRHGGRGYCLLNLTPELFGRQLDRVAQILAQRPEDERFLMIKSWNEWAEGNIMEPSAQFGDSFLTAFSDRFHLNTDAQVAPGC